MATTIVSPKFGSVDTWRDVINRNPQLKREGRKVHFVLHTHETWLPNVLVQAGFFDSGNKVKKNLPKFWRDLVHGEVIELSWSVILICRHIS